MKFDSPFLIVYIGTSLFSVFLPIRLGYERFGHLLHKNEIVVIPWGNYPAPTASRRSLEHHDHDETNISVDDAQELMQSPTENGNDSEIHRNNNSKNSVELTTSYLDESTSAEASALGILDDFSFNNEFCIQHYEPSRSMEESRRINNGNNSSQNTTTSDNNNDDDKQLFSTYLLSHRDHISMASKVAPMWFLSNYFYAMSLEWTSIASSTVLASMGSIFAFGFATCSKFGDETVTRGKIIGVLLCFLGGVATTYTDSGGDNSMRHLTGQFHVSELDSSTRSLLGDLCGLVSAIGYGAYTVTIRHLCPKDEDRMTMQLLFGYIGLLNMIILLPVAIWVTASSHDDYSSEDSESVEEPFDYSDPEDYTPETTSHVLTMPIFLFLLLKGLLDNVLSDYLWARAVILTSATVASVGVGLTIPMAFAADYFMGNYTGSQSGEVWGAILVLIGFVFVNIDGFRKRM
eukprot:CAMPEP_0201733404 /NCGR_PEP_ID=MMETSP0593-20130828/31497_1 /ASSEMBLY_ACC=CAM_ASM_000672 /TAXON_ID=267983 /ORGANISM="Skeletonema japonicum, Strain CCMP2506" /LENGTH=460 /DNA_ID=CAMNT_0048226545 /DNA_START=65 /DNA_END=1447 /DNA_ORIENTATION=-